MLDQVLGKLARQNDPNVLVGFDHADDAGVYLVSPNLAMVQTVDFFTPIVDDPYTFGQIAAVNSLSDVYAMGGRPVSALTVVCFPDNKLRLDILEKILAGGLSKMVEAGCTVVGGHSIRADEITFGYAVTGVIDPTKVKANSGAQAGDALVFTKALGTGVLSTAIKMGEVEQTWMDAAVKSMTTLNKAAAELALKYGAHGMTDVTGFGFIGHARELGLASNVSLRIRAAELQALPGAMECIERGYIPGGLNKNREFAECCVEFAQAVPENIRTLVFDPQTAGGLLISLPAKNAAPLVAELRAAGLPAAHVGDVVERTEPLIYID